MDGEETRSREDCAGFGLDSTGLRLVLGCSDFPGEKGAFLPVLLCPLTAYILTGRPTLSAWPPTSSFNRLNSPRLCRTLSSLFYIIVLSRFVSSHTFSFYYGPYELFLQSFCTFSLSCTANQNPPTSPQRCILR